MHPFVDLLAIYVAPDDGPVTGHVEATIERRSQVEKSKMIGTLTKQRLVELHVMERVVEGTIERRKR